MYSLLLAIIYVAFISLGLPDSLLGSAWPVMHMDLLVPVSFAGIVTIIISSGTIVSSLMSDRLTKKFGPGLVTAVSVLMTATALFGFSTSKSFIFLCLWAIPYGLGAGAVDAALNNYVALHYSSRHMNWLHCFWGVGAAASPYIMSYSLTGGHGWNSGYRYVAIVQIALTSILFIMLPLWKKKRGETTEKVTQGKALTLRETVKIKGVPQVLIMFASYCAVEQMAMLWTSTYLVDYRGIDVETAARFASLFFLGLTIGRFLCGFVSDRLGDKTLIRIGIVTVILGTLLIILPLKTDIFALAGLVIAGFGCAPTYPAIIHSTPSNFGEENSQAIIGIQMASAYAGATFLPPLFGFLASHFGIKWFPFYMLAFTILMFVMSERLNKIVAKRSNGVTEKLEV